LAADGARCECWIPPELAVLIELIGDEAYVEKLLAIFDEMVTGGRW
jgi:hypothetical protein